MVMRSRLSFRISLPTHTVIFWFPPPTLNTPSNPSLTPNFAPSLQGSDDKDFETKSLEMSTELFLSNVAIRPITVLDSATRKAFSNSRRDILKQPLAKISDDKIPLVLTFRHFNYTVRDVISRKFKKKFKNPETTAIFTDNPLVSFRRNKNIRDNLVRSDKIYRFDLICPPLIKSIISQVWLFMIMCRLSCVDYHETH